MVSLEWLEMGWTWMFKLLNYLYFFLFFSLFLWKHVFHLCCKHFLNIIWWGFCWDQICEMILTTNWNLNMILCHTINVRGRVFQWCFWYMYRCTYVSILLWLFKTDMYIYIKAAVSVHSSWYLLNYCNAFITSVKQNFRRKVKKFPTALP